MLNWGQGGGTRIKPADPAGGEGKEGWVGRRRRVVVGVRGQAAVAYAAGPPVASMECERVRTRYHEWRNLAR